MSKLAVMLILVTVMPAFAEWQDRPDSAVHFKLEGVQGTIAVLDLPVSSYSPPVEFRQPFRRE